MKYELMVFKIDWFKVKTDILSDGNISNNITKTWHYSCLC